MKNVITALVVVLLVAGGGYLFVKNKSRIQVDPKITDFCARHIGKALVYERVTRSGRGRN